MKIKLLLDFLEPTACSTCRVMRSVITVLPLLRNRSCTSRKGVGYCIVQEQGGGGDGGAPGGVYYVTLVPYMNGLPHNC